MADVVVGDNNLNKPSRFSFIKKHKWQLLIIAGLLIVAGTAAYLLTPKNTDTAFMVDGKNYSKKEISSMADQASNTNSALARDNFTRQVYQMYITQSASEKAKITPNKRELQYAATQVNNSSNSSKPLKDYYNLLTYNIALDKSYDRYKGKQYTGWSFVYTFGKNADDFSSAEPGSSKPDKTKYYEDKIYAKNQADIGHDQIKKNQIQPQKLITKINNNTRLSYLRASTYFSPDNVSDIRSKLFFQDINNYVISQNKPGLSSVKIGKASYTPDNDNLIDYFYYFVRIDSIEQPIKNPKQTVKNTENSINKKYYGTDQ